MKSLLKKSMLAASVAVAFGASAGTVSVTKQTHSIEGLAGVTANQTSNSISYTVAAAYAVGDKITFTFPEGALVATTFPSQINVPAINNATAANAIAGMGLGLLNSTASSVTYRVTSLSQPNNAATSPVDYTDRTTIGAVVTLGSIGYKPASVLSSDVTVTVSSETTVGDALDTSGTRTATVAEAKSQFGSVALSHTFDNVIDVAEMRQKFVGSQTDSITYTITNPVTTGWLNVASVNATDGTMVTLYGEAGKFEGLTSSDFSAAGTVTVDEAAAQVMVKYNGQVTTDTIQFTAPGDKVLETQSFTTDYVYNYTSAGSVAGSKTVDSGVASGEWKLNGATVNVPYMPYSVNANAILYVTNEGSQTGDISVTAIDDIGQSYDLGVIGTANAKTITRIATPVKQALELAGFDMNGKVSLTITVNAPESDITVYASYNVGGSDRGMVITDQYKKDSSK
ncbi:MAG: hypothetical protein CMK65_00905 [Pseudoalteromonas sp.]|uniref:hypothetical protein n=1 Tax=Pseudoalteromonas sp. TaxID=53249 RepID=UPI000C94C375|nr:hypothetical protein [Pseudoalteromonas sp.]MAD02172.1 hypothetical protein [Pseudoalteromonas sp.]|tara:strand:+ start:20288 stop:21652 length:1365 start_codon:yes stop_codon:yes gene_type:complete